MAGYVEPNNNKNKFQSQYRFVGKESLPSLKKGDLATLIYNSNTSTLSFMLNGKAIDGKIVNVPKEPLYWFAARLGEAFVVKIVTQTE